MEVTGLFTYPVKSLRGVSHCSVDVGAFGLNGDRRWMLVDADGRFVTQRNYPQLSLVRVEIINANELLVIFPNNEAYSLSPEFFISPVSVKVWRDQVDCFGNKCDELGAAFSRYLDLTVSMVYFSDNCFRQIDQDYVAVKQSVSFSDGFPVLLLNEASLADLNSRLDMPVTMNRFRGNIVINADYPFIEDGWSEIKIGDVRFSVVKPCSRCVMTTIDPENGLKSADGQPLKVLSSYRRTSKGVIFGQNIVQLNQGKINLGDKVTVVR